MQQKPLSLGHGQTIYRFRGQIPAGKTDLEQIYKDTVGTILDFFKKECIHSLPPEAWAPGDFNIRELDCYAKCRTIPDIFVWSIRLRFIEIKDATETESMNICESRVWHYDIGIAEVNGQLEFGFEVASEQHFISPTEIHLRLLSVLSKEMGLTQGRVIDGKPLIVKDAAGAELLYDLLSCQVRNLPVVVVSEINPRAWSLTPDPPSYLLDVPVLASYTLGYAHVVQLTYSGSREWTQIAGTAWAVYDGAIRVFKPSFNINFSNPGEHPVFFKDQIWEYRYDHINGPRALFALMLTTLHRNASSRFVSWKGIMFQPGASAVKNTLEKINHSNKATAAANREHSLLEQVRGLEDKLEIAQSQTREREKKLSSLTERNRNLEAMVSSMQDTIEHMSGYDHSQETAVPNTGEIEIPNSFKDMAAWCEIYLHDRLYLHPRAERAIEKAEYENPQLVYRALLALAFEYRDSKLGKGSEKAFKARCSELKIQKRVSITKFKAKGEGDTYYVNYPFHTSKRRLLQWALAKGNSRKKNFCMRIYFFWDDTGKQVVVGYLPGHLDNRIS